MPVGCPNPQASYNPLRLPVSFGIDKKGLHVQSDYEHDEFIQQLRNGSDAAAEQLVRTQIGWMRGLALRILHDADAADDCVQDAFINAFRHIDKFKGDSTLKTWLHRIVVNTALMRLRKRKRLSEVSIDELQPQYDTGGGRLDGPPSQTATPADILMQQDQRQLVLQAISRLPENHRIVLLLRDIEEQSTTQVAVALGISEANVKVRLHRGRAALKTLLEPLLHREGQ